MLISVEVCSSRESHAKAGKSGGFRTIVLFRTGNHGFFVHGFAKSDNANVSAKELKALKQLAGVLLGFSDQVLRRRNAPVKWSKW